MKTIKKHLLILSILSFGFTGIVHSQPWVNGGNCNGGTPDIIGTTCAEDIQFIVNNIFEGMLDQTGNVFFGQNTGLGNTGTVNTGIGSAVLSNANTGHVNVGVGYGCLNAFQTGNDNIAIGDKAMASTNTADDNIAIGSQALRNVNGTNSNIAIGNASLINHQMGYTIGIGYQALTNNVSGDQNTGVGTAVLFQNTTGSFNTAVGYKSLVNNNGDENSALGEATGATNTTGSCNTYVGFAADGAANNLVNSTAVGCMAQVLASNTIMLGDVNTQRVQTWGVYQQLSDGRYKTNITSNVPGLKFINLLKPVTYNLNMSALNQKFYGSKEKLSEQQRSQMEKGASEKEKIVYSGFVAQDVEEVAKKIGYDFCGVNVPINDNDVYNLSYGEFVVPLVKAVQELSSENENLRKEINQLKETVYSSTSEGSVRISIDENTAMNGSLLGQNIPNPADKSTVIPFRVSKNCNSASIVITEMASGKIVKAIPVSCSETHLVVEAGTLASGTYTYSLLVDGKTLDSKQMIFAK